MKPKRGKNEQTEEQYLNWQKQKVNTEIVDIKQTTSVIRVNECKQLDY